MAPNTALAEFAAGGGDAAGGAAALTVYLFSYVLQEAGGVSRCWECLVGLWTTARPGAPLMMMMLINVHLTHVGH